MVSTYPSRHLRSGRLRQRSQLACRRRSIADGPNEMGVATVGAREGVPIGGPTLLALGELADELGLDRRGFLDRTRVVLAAPAS